MPPVFDIIRSLIAALKAAMISDSADKASAATANSHLGQLQKQIDDLNKKLADSDQATVAHLGHPLTPDETQDLSHTLANLAAAPKIELPAAPASTEPTPPVGAPGVAVPMPGDGLRGVSNVAPSNADITAKNSGIDPAVATPATGAIPSVADEIALDEATGSTAASRAEDAAKTSKGIDPSAD